MIEPSTAADSEALFKRLRTALEHAGKSVRMHGSPWWIYGPNDMCFRLGLGVFHVGTYYPPDPDKPNVYEKRVRVCVSPRQEPFGRYEILGAADVQSFVLEALRIATTFQNCIDTVGDRGLSSSMLAYAERGTDKQEPG